ncbi:MAG: hypothetical protein ACT4OS_12630 [Acidimicrobiales bacterium]
MTQPDELPPGQPGDRLKGRGLLAAARWGTTWFVVAQAGAVLRRNLASPAAALNVALFALGCVACLVALARAAARSRTQQVGVGSLFFLSGAVAPPSVRRVLLGAAAAQLVVGVVAASLRPFTIVATAILVPVYGIGLLGLWAALHGDFPDRPPRGTGRGN